MHKKLSIDLQGILNLRKEKIIWFINEFFTRNKFKFSPSGFDDSANIMKNGEFLLSTWKNSKSVQDIL